AVRNDYVLIFRGGTQLVIAIDGKGLPLIFQNAFGLIDVGLPQRGTQVFQAQAVRRQRHDGRIGGIDFAVNRRVRQVARQKSCRGVDGGLNFLLSNVNVLFQIELQSNDRTAKGTG